MPHVEQELFILSENVSSPPVFSRVRVTEYLCHKWPPICSVCRNHNPDISSFMTYQRGYQNNTTGASCGTGTWVHPRFLVGYMLLYIYIVSILFNLLLFFCVFLVCRPHFHHINYPFQPRLIFLLLFPFCDFGNAHRPHWKEMLFYTLLR